MLRAPTALLELARSMLAYGPAGRPSLLQVEAVVDHCLDLFEL
jgi:hypothetical protein